MPSLTRSSRAPQKEAGQMSSYPSFRSGKSWGDECPDRHRQQLRGRAETSPRVSDSSISVLSRPHSSAAGDCKTPRFVPPSLVFMATQLLPSTTYRALCLYSPVLQLFSQGLYLLFQGASFMSYCLFLKL